MELRANILFYLLLKVLAPGLVCDIGSRDGYNSIRFRRFSPGSKIIAFEANPYNAKAMMGDPVLLKSELYVENKAVSNKDGEVVFHVERPKDTVYRSGISSLRRPVDDVAEREAVSVSAVRLDNYIRSQKCSFGRIALWIDVEGLGYEVLEGITGIKDQVCLIHIEVETKVFWQGQHLKPDVERLLNDMGFQFLGRGMPEEQHDLVYINKAAFDRSPVKFRLITMLAFVCSYAQAFLDRFRPQVSGKS